VEPIGWKKWTKIASLQAAGLKISVQNLEILHRKNIHTLANCYIKKMSYAIYYYYYYSCRPQAVPLSVCL